MRKFIQKQLLELIDTINEGVAYVVKKNDNSEVSENILIDCYSSIKFIEENLSVNLSKSCFSGYYSLTDNIKNSLEVLNDTIRNNDNIDISAENVKNDIKNLKNRLKNEKEIKLEVVFIPYKASMWDSLESVWKAADNDKNCDAYVIPIPYFDKNPDGSFREMHYEGNQYPNYVPITKYDEFDFGAHRPDMIFIHNPYDQYNFVTSVHPFFYSDNLKKFTEKLIYIPYFVLREIDPNNEKRAVENIKHFCTLSAVFNADKIIVQSEKIRQIYIDTLTEATGRKAKSVWEKKILGLGSPKFDKAANNRKEDLEIPDKWLKIIEKPDGSWKKIIFYNTSVAALLKYNEKMLEKMKFIFQIFKENQGEITLLWRPHPLIKATIKSMRPKLSYEYDRIVRTYIKEGWGIYDDTADMDRAIILCDAYYGDASSLVELCKKLHKPIMLQNPNI